MYRIRLTESYLVKRWGTVDALQMEDDVKANFKKLKETTNARTKEYKVDKKVIKRWVIFCPLVGELSDPSMRPRHWSALVTLCDKQLEDRSQRSSFSVTCGTWNFTNFPQRPSVGLWVRTCSGLCYALHGILLHHGRAMGSRTLDASTERRNHCGRLKKYHESCGIVGDGLGWPQLQQPDGVSAAEMVGARRRSRIIGLHVSAWLWLCIRCDGAGQKPAREAVSFDCNLTFSEPVGGMVWGIAVDEMHRLLVAPSLDYMVYVWNMTWAEPARWERHMLDGHKDEVWRVAVLSEPEVGDSDKPAKPRFLTGSLDGTVKVWSKTGEGFRGQLLYNTSHMVTALASSAWIAHGDKSGLIGVWWQPGRWYRALQADSIMIQALAFMPQNLLIAASDDGWVRIWNVTVGEVQLAWRANNGSVVSLAVDQSLATSGYDRIGIREPWSLQLWDPGTSRLVSATCKFGVVTHVANFGRDHLVFGGPDYLLYIVLLPTWEVVQTLKGPEDAVHALHTFDGFIVSGSADRMVRLWRCYRTACDSDDFTGFWQCEKGKGDDTNWTKRWRRLVSKLSKRQRWKRPLLSSPGDQIVCARDGVLKIWSTVEFVYEKHKGTDVLLMRLRDEDVEILEENQASSEHPMPAVLRP
eukprot:s5397_g2.t1